jgi:hypothetical protein
MTRIEHLIASLLVATPAQVDELVEEVTALRYDLTRDEAAQIRRAVRNLTIADARRVLAAL